MENSHCVHNRRIRRSTVLFDTGLWVSCLAQMHTVLILIVSVCCPPNSFGVECNACPSSSGVICTSRGECEVS